MSLNFHVTKQKIKRRDNSSVVAGSKNFLTATFSFSEEWNGKIKTAVFEKGDTVYHVVLENDKIKAEKMPVFSEGVWKVSVFGGDLITADCASLPVYPSGYREENVPAAPAVSVYETLTSMIQKNMEKTEALEDKITGGGTPLEIIGDTLYVG